MLVGGGAVSAYLVVDKFCAALEFSWSCCTAADC